jgi:hypothetical protein
LATKRRCKNTCKKRSKTNWETRLWGIEIGIRIAQENRMHLSVKKKTILLISTQTKQITINKPTESYTNILYRWWTTWWYCEEDGIKESFKICEDILISAVKLTVDRRQRGILYSRNHWRDVPQGTGSRQVERIGKKDLSENGNDEEENNCKMDAGRSWGNQWQWGSRRACEKNNNWWITNALYATITASEQFPRAIKTLEQ